MAKGTSTVLLISDDRTENGRIKDQLDGTKGHRYRLDAVPTLKAGFERLSNHPIDAILLDLDLRDSSGLATFLHLYPKAGEIPIVLLPGAGDEELGVRAMEKGALEYLLKGTFDGNLLVRTLRYATERTHTMLALKASEAKYRGLYDTVTAGVFQTTPDGTFLAANPGLLKMLGYESEDELLGRDIAESIYMYPEDRENWSRAITEAGKIRNAELILKRKDGGKVVVLENSRAETDDNGRVLYYEGTLTDITEAHELSQQLSYEASHDSLTGLINRREFELRLQRMLDTVHVDKATHAVCYLDLDQFKVINDTCGHIAGDELLRQVGMKLNEKIRTADTLARLGGDEFGVILANCSLENAAKIADELRRAVEQLKFVWTGTGFTIGVSVGVVQLTFATRRITEILSAADAACYAAKDQGRNRVHVYHEDDTVLMQRHGEMQWVSRVKRALEEDRFHLVYQPIVATNPATAANRHYEFLVRMEDSQGGVVPPGAFLPAVERYNLSVRLDIWVVQRAFNWLTSHPQFLEGNSLFFINLSGDTLSEETFHITLTRLLKSKGLPPQKICFEITETAAIANLSRARKFIDSMRGEGCRFALDDFGSGLCSFAYLKNLPVDFIKIDGVFIREVDRDSVDAEMVKSIKDIGHVMGKQVIAEHVERESVLQKLRDIGVDYAQGYAIAEPRPITELLAEHMGAATRLPGGQPITARRKRVS